MHPPVLILIRGIFLVPEDCRIFVRPKTIKKFRNHEQIEKAGFIRTCFLEFL